MKIEELDEEFPWTPSVLRSEGVHVYEIIRDLLDTLGMTPKQGDDDDDGQRRMQYEKGYLWEEILSAGFGNKSPVRPGEMELDGIIGSPDGIGFEDTEDENGFKRTRSVVEEYKCTSKSSAKTPDEVTPWMMQVKGYCKICGANVVVFRVLYINGNYRDIRYPVYRPYRLEFSQREIDENWEMLINHAKSRGWL